MQVFDLVQNASLYTEDTASDNQHVLGCDDLAMFSPTDKKAYRYLQNGMIAKAFDVLCNKNSPVSASEVVYAKLKSKHPSDQLHDCNNEKVINDIRNFEVDPEDKIIIAAEDLLLLIRGLKSCVKPGIDKLRNKHLQQMVGYKRELDPDEQQFLNYLTDIVNIIVQGKEPPDVATVLSSNEMFAAPKSGDDVRPIGIGTTLRKLAAKALLNASQANFNATHFKDLQLALKKNGMEEIIHMFAETMERDPTLDVFCADGDNAFNAANRIRGLREVKENFPAALAYAKDMYLEESTAWYHGLPDNIKPVFCRNGYHQGDVLASWLYVMTIQPLLVHIKATIQSKFPDEWFLVKFYVDDENFIAPSRSCERLSRFFKTVTRLLDTS